MCELPSQTAADPEIFFCFRNADTVGREHVCMRERERELYIKSKIYKDRKKQN